MGCGRSGPCGARLPSGADVRPELDALLVRRADHAADVSDKPKRGGFWAWLTKPKNTNGPPNKPKKPKT